MSSEVGYIVRLKRSVVNVDDVVRQKTEMYGIRAEQVFRDSIKGFTIAWQPQSTINRLREDDDVEAVEPDIITHAFE